MELMYSSTRNKNEKVTASQAILKGLATDGGNWDFITLHQKGESSPFYEKYEELLAISKKFRLSKNAKILIGFVAFYVLLGIILYVFRDQLF